MAMLLRRIDEIQDSRFKHRYNVTSSDIHKIIPYGDIPWGRISAGESKLSVL